MSSDAKILQKGKVAKGGYHGGEGDRAAENVIPFGCGVQLGTDPDTQVKKFAGGVFYGVALYDPTKGVTVDGSGNTISYKRYNIGDAVSVIRKASGIVVEVEDAVDAGDAVYCNNTTGNFQKGSSGGTLVGGAKFVTSATGDGELAELDINLP